MLQVFFRGGEPLVSRPLGHGISGEGEVADGKLMIRKLALEKGLEPAVVLKASRSAVANDGDVVALFEGKFGAGERNGSQREGEGSSGETETPAR